MYKLRYALNIYVCVGIRRSSNCMAMGLILQNVTDIELCACITVKTMMYNLINHELVLIYTWELKSGAKSPFPHHQYTVHGFHCVVLRSIHTCVDCMEYTHETQASSPNIDNVLVCPPYAMCAIRKQFLLFLPPHSATVVVVQQQLSQQSQQQQQQQIQESGREEPNHCLHCIITFCPWYLLIWICICCCYGC